MGSPDNRYLQDSSHGTRTVGPQFPCRADLGPWNRGSLAGILGVGLRNPFRRSIGEGAVRGMARNRYADLLRALAAGGVVYGHWLLISVTCYSRNRRFRALGTFGPCREGSGSVDWRDVRGRRAAGRGQFRRGPGPAGAPCSGWRAAGCLARRLRSRAGRPRPGRPARLGAAGSRAGQGARREPDRPRGRGSCATEMGGDRPWRWTVPGAGC